MTHTPTHDIVAKLWRLCNVLRDDGITYHQYVTELTYLLFLKMAEETNQAGADRTDDYRWATIAGQTGIDLLDHYRAALVFLGSAKNTRSHVVRQVYQNASTSLRKPKNLRTLVAEIDALDWYSATQEGLGRSLRGPAREERRGEEVRGRAVLHAAPAHRQHDRGHAAPTRRGRPRPGRRHRGLSRARARVRQGADR